MATARYPETALEREYLRDSLRRQGADSIDQIAQAIRERWAHSPLRSYRKACELSLEQVCDQVNRILEVFASEAGYFTHSTLSRYETWPAAPKSRRPTLAHLVALAEVYRTSPRNLVADPDWARFPPADRYALRALATTPEPSGGTTETTAPTRMMDQVQPAVAGGPANPAKPTTVAPPFTTGMMERARPQAGRTPHSPPTRWTGPDPTQSGDPSGRDILMTGEESAQYAEHGGNIADMTLDQLRAEASEQAAAFAGTDQIDIFTGVRQLRDRIFAYLDGGQSMRQRRDLYFLAGVSCGLLAGASDNLGYPTAAMSHARAGHVFALEAGDPALSGWMYVMQAMISYWNGQPSKARQYASRGQAAHPSGTIDVWLPAIEARAGGELGDVEATRLAIDRATQARGSLQRGSLDEFGGLMHFNMAKQHFYAADAYLGLGDDHAVIEQANEAINAYVNGPVEEFHYSDMAIIRLHAAVAHTRSGGLDAAVQFAQAALDVGVEHRNAHVDTSARRLHRHLRTAGLRKTPLAIETRDQIEEFLSVTPARLELS